MIFRSPREKPHLVLLIGDDGILCLPFRMPGAPPPFFADHNDERLRFIPSLAAKHREIPVTLLADTLSQDLRRDALPRLSRFDRAACSRHSRKRA